MPWLAITAQRRPTCGSPLGTAEDYHIWRPRPDNDDMTDSSLAPDRLDEASRQMAQNAALHVEDAAVLIEHERWRGAYVLATLALEEIGKAWALQQPGDPQHRAAFFNTIKRDHVAKIGQARQFGAWVDQFSRGHDEAAETVIDLEAVFDEGHQYLADDDHDRRMSGTDVDILNGLPVGGSDAITEQEAKGHVEFAHTPGHVMLNYLTVQPHPVPAGARPS